MTPASPSVRLRRRGRLVLGLAVAYAVVLLPVGLYVPVYSTDGVTSSGESADGSATLVAVNGPGVLVVLAVPLLLTLVVAAVLARPRRWSLPVAWTACGLMAALTLLGLLSIGLLLVPVTAALVVACLSVVPVQVRGPVPAAPPQG